MYRLCLLFSLLYVISLSAPTVDVRLLNLFSESPEQSFIVKLKPYPLDTTNVHPPSKPAYVYERLSSWARETQYELIQYLEENNIEHTPYWITNSVVIKQSNYATAMALAEMPNVLHIEPNAQFKANLEKPDPETSQVSQPPRTIEWNIEWVKAPAVWRDGDGFNGTGFVVANADTGVAWQHPALIKNYRGYNEGSPNHNYNWWDSIHSGPSGVCGINAKAPCDDSGHGTHTTGTAVGIDEAQGYYIGVAPGAQWIACRNMNDGLGTPQTYIECLEFFVAPWDLNKQNPDPSKAPHVIGNSYGCPNSEGCQSDSLQEAVDHVIAAGIFMSVSAGNAGPSCSTIDDPPAMYDNVCSVGATQYLSSTITSFSSRGPVPGLSFKPDIVAPGASIRSAYPPNRYTSMSGTSMASPAVTGAIPLIWQARPEYLRNPVETTNLLRRSATERRISTSECSSTPGARYNNIYGYGELDIDRAIKTTI